VKEIFNAIFANSRAVCLWGAGLAVILLVVSTPALADLCSDYKAAVKAADDNFQSIRDSAIDVGRWKSKQQIQGFQTCYVASEPFSQLACTQSFATKQEARSRLASAMSAMESCLGDEWLVSGVEDLKSLVSPKNSTAVNFAVMNSGAISGGRLVDRYFFQTWINKLQNAPGDDRSSSGPNNVSVEPDGAIPDGYCSDLKKVVDASAEQFTSILGRKNSLSWTARVQMSDWIDCHISELDAGKPETRYYSCTGPTFSTTESIGKAMQSMKPTISACLGSE